MSDRLHDTLDALRPDVDRVGLADAGSVRRRGNQRTRRQALGAVAAAVLAVVAAVGVSADLGGADRDSLPPATKSVPVDAFLAADELPAYYPAYSVASRTATVDDAQPGSCLPGLRIRDAEAAGATSYTAKAANRYPVTSLHAVWRLPSAADAERAEVQVELWLNSCPRRLHQRMGISPINLGPGRYVDHTLGLPALTDAVPHEALLIVRNGDLLSVLSAVNVSQDADVPSALDNVLATMAGRIGAEVPRSALSTGALLQLPDLPTLKPYTWSVGETVEPAVTVDDATRRNLTVCGEAVSGSAESQPYDALLRTYPSDLDASMWEWVAQYATTAEADAALEAMKARCAGANPQPLAPLQAGATGFVASSFGADPGSEYHGEVVGVGRTGTVVVVLGLRGNLQAKDSNLDGFTASAVTAVDRVSAAGAQ